MGGGGGGHGGGGGLGGMGGAEVGGDEMHNTSYFP